MNPRRIFIALALAFAAFCAYEAGQIQGRIEQRAAAYHCALNSELSDGAIAECYTSRGLPAPADILGDTAP